MIFLRKYALNWTKALTKRQKVNDNFGSSLKNPCAMLPKVQAINEGLVGGGGGVVSKPLSIMYCMFWNF